MLFVFKGETKGEVECRANLEQEYERASDLNFASQSLLALEPRSGSLLQKRHLVCGQRIADKKQNKRHTKPRRHCFRLNAVGCQLGSVRALPFSENTSLP